MCFMYLFQIFLCTSPFVLMRSTDGTQIKDESVFSVIYKILSSLGDVDKVGGIVRFVPYFLLVIIPVAGFFLCALDTQRNLKNVCSLIFNFAAIMSILMVVPVSAMQIGSVVQMLLYVVLSFLASVAMVLRLNKTEEPEPVKKKIPKEEREY